MTYSLNKYEWNCSNLESYFHMVNAAVGTGILALPRAFDNAGLYGGCIYVVLIGILLTYCFHMLVSEFLPYIQLVHFFPNENMLQIRGKYIICKKVKLPYITYGQALDLCFQMGPPITRGLAPYCMFVKIPRVRYQYS